MIDVGCSVLTKYYYCQRLFLSICYAAMNDPTTYLLRAVERFLARTGMAPTSLGRRVLGDPSFVRRLKGGRVPRLDTADRLLAFMGERPIGPAFRSQMEAFVAVTGMKPYVLGEYAMANPSFVTRLNGGSAPKLTTVERVLSWMTAHASEAEREAVRALAGNMEGKEVGACGTRNGTPAEGFAGKGGGTACKPINTNSNQLNNMKMKENTHDRMNGNLNGNGTGPHGTEYLSTTLAAAFLGLSPRTLDRYRVTGEGPEFYRFGSRIRYRREDLETWAAARRMRSTSDDRHPSSSASRRED